LRNSEVQRRLKQIEGGLQADDPDFVRVMRRPRTGRRASWLVIVGLAAPPILDMLAESPAVAATGLAVIAVTEAVAVVVLFRPRRPTQQTTDYRNR
jgi:hypothetical protein